MKFTKEELDEFADTGYLWVCQSCGYETHTDYVYDSCPSCGIEVEEENV
jgi:rubrerythrin